MAVEPVTIIQITDTHLFADNQECLKGIPTYQSLQVVLSDTANRFPYADAYLFTGDLSQDGSPESYIHLKELVEKLNKSCFVIPGNHDDLSNIKTFLTSDHVFLEDYTDVGGWRIILMNTQVVNEEHGFVSDRELKKLKTNIIDKTYNYLVCIHHPPIDLECFIDETRLRNESAFFDAIGTITGQVVVIWGHAHQEYVERRNNLLLLGAPSSCVQFKPKESVFVKDELPPGYRVLKLYASGRVDTEIVRVYGS
ncbi:MAG: metallophosphoesterase [Arenicellales bacterium]|nr:metallophosphoesterase [Arenicellales bacterium]